jgi:hypothetical protein
MVWNKKYIHGTWLIALAMVMMGCRVSLGLAPISSIDYNLVKTMQIVDFQNHADYVYGPLATTLNDQMKDLFMRQTRLSLVNNGGDIVIDGEITGYNQFNEAIDASGYSSKVRLTLTVKVSYTNNTNHEEDFENRTFTAFQTYDATQLLTAVQDQLIAVMVKDISEQIFNSTVANW